jgi:oxygen-independent coproporphyrinogen-3 oxidase
MDHFALETDSLYDAFQNGTLHRNFMGYSSSKTQLMIDWAFLPSVTVGTSFAQNVKNLEDYYQILEWNKLPVLEGIY